MKHILAAMCACALIILGGARAEAQPTAVGDWHGVLSTPNGRLALLVRVQAGANGTHTGDLESLDQAPGQKIPLANLVVSAGKFAFSIPSIGATYDAEWNEAAQVWSGVFRQGMALPLLLKRGTPPALTVVAGLDGTWRALLKRDTVTLRLVLHVRTSTRGTAVTLDSPDAGALGLEVQRFALHGDTVRFHVPDAQVEFVGTLREGRRTFRGRWSRHGRPDTDVSFDRDTAATTRAVRTQWPVAPKGYRVEQVKFANPADITVTLAGTLTVPDGRGPFPAAVLISGSGAQDRDESLAGHKPFAVLADHLSRRGIAVLRYDDRGFGASTGDHGRATSADFATDANAAVRFLLDRKEIDRTAIGFIGHSEGGMIGPIAAVENDRVAYLVLLAGPGTNIDKLMLSQRRMMGRAQGMSTTQLDMTESAVRNIFSAVRTAPDSQLAVERVRALLTNETLLALGIPSAQRDAVAHVYAGTWMRYFLKYEPASFLPRLRVPILALNGSLDLQVPASENLDAMRKLLAGNSDATVRELPGLNHLFQTARTGAMSEYESIAETFSPTAMDQISGWISARYGRARATRGRAN